MSDQKLYKVIIIPAFCDTGMSKNFDARRQMRAVLFPSLLSTLFSVSCTESYATPRIVETPSSQPEKQNSIAVDISYSYATNTGLELEVAYQEQLRKQKPGVHVITVGDYGEPGSALHIGNVPAAVKTLKQALQGEVLVLEYGKDFFSGDDLIDFLAKKQERPITSIHSFGHGDPMQYWIGLYPDDSSLTVTDIKNIPLEKRAAIKENLADDSVWKIYICHGAADLGYSHNGSGISSLNFAKTIAEELEMQVTASNAWVFIETTKKGVFMFPASRERHRLEFEVRKPSLGVEVPDPLYTGEAAWVTYAPQKKE